MDFSSADISCSNGPSTFTYPFSPECYSVADPMIFDDNVNSYYQLPINLEICSTKNDIIQSSSPQPSQQTYAPRPNSRLDTNLQLKAIEAQKSQVPSKDYLKRKPPTEESARRRRDQNRASQRAYRARRERHIEELEQRNKFLQRHASALLEENERLKLQLSQLIKAHNRLTKDRTARSSVSPASSTVVSSLSSAQQHDRGFLDVKETWDLIQDHWLFKCGHVRIEDVYQKLKEEPDMSLDGMQKRVDVIKAIESSSVGRHYDLL